VKNVILGIVVLCGLLVAVPAGAGQEEPGPCEGTGKGAYQVIELHGPDTSLVLFGTRHRTDLADPVWAELEQRVAKLQPTVILVEGSGPPSPTREFAITHGGDGSFLCWLASQRGIDCQSLDLAEPEEARRLLLRHAPDEVLLFFTVRVLAYFNPRPPTERPPGDLIQWTLRRYGPMAGLPNATSGDLASTCQRALHRTWDPDAVTTDWHDPRKSDLLTQRMSQESNDLREPYILERLLVSAENGARVFAAVGEGHLCNLEANLRTRWKETRTGSPRRSMSSPAAHGPQAEPTRPSAASGTPGP
jgi:hypothetical protein